MSCDKCIEYTCKTVLTCVIHVCFDWHKMENFAMGRFSAYHKTVYLMIPLFVRQNVFMDQ